MGIMDTIKSTIGKQVSSQMDKRSGTSSQDPNQVGQVRKSRRVRVRRGSQPGQRP